MRKRHKRTFRLIIYMIICMTATALVFAGSVKCGSCDQKVERKYYITEYHEPLCLSCAGKYYNDSDILKNKYFQKTDNSLKTVLLTSEGLIFAVLIVGVNLRRKKPVKQTENGYTSGVDSKVRSVITRESLEYPERKKVRTTVKEPIKEPIKETVRKTVKEPVKKPADKNTDSLKKTKASSKVAGDSIKTTKKSSDVPATKSSAKSSVAVNKGNQKKESSDNKRTKKSAETKK